MINLTEMRTAKFERCYTALNRIATDEEHWASERAQYDCELLQEYKAEYIANGYKNIPDRIIAELMAI